MLYNNNNVIYVFFSSFIELFFFNSNHKQNEYNGICHARQRLELNKIIIRRIKIILFEKNQQKAFVFQT